MKMVNQQSELEITVSVTDAVCCEQEKGIALARIYPHVVKLDHCPTVDPTCTQCQCVEPHWQLYTNMMDCNMNTATTIFFHECSFIT